MASRETSPCPASSPHIGALEWEIGWAEEGTGYICEQNRFSSEPPECTECEMLEILGGEPWCQRQTKEMLAEVIGNNVAPSTLAFLWGSCYCRLLSRVGEVLIYIYIGWREAEKAMATQSSTLGGKIPWAEEPGRLQSMGSLRVRYDWVTSLSLFTFMHWRRKWQTHSSVLAWRIPGTGEPGGLPSMGSHRVGHDWSDLAEAAAAGWCEKNKLKVARAAGRNWDMTETLSWVEMVVPWPRWKPWTW